MNVHSTFDDQHFEAIFNQSFQFALILDTDGTVIKMNKPCNEVCGKYAENVTGNPFWKAGWWSDFYDVEMLTKKAVQKTIDGEIVKDDVKFKDKNDKIRYGTRIFSPIKDDIGEIVMISVVGLDISDIKAAEKRITKVNQRLQQAHNIAKLGYWDWEMSTGELTWSDDVYRIFGRDKKSFETTAESFEACIHPDDYKEFLNEREFALAENRPIDIEHRIILPDGSIRYVKELAEIIRDKNGNIVKVSGTVQDITEHKLIEIEIKDSEKRYRTLFMHNPNPIAVIDSSGNYLDANEAFTNFVETPKGKLLTMNAFDFSPPNIKKDQEKNHVPAWEKGNVLETEYLINGKIKLLELSIMPIVYKNSKAVIGVGKDITDHKRVEKELIAGNERFKSLFNSTNDGICLHEIVYQGNAPVDYKILEINPKYEMVTGLRKEDAIGALASELYGVEKAPYLDIYYQVVTNKVPTSFETYFEPMDKHFLISVFTPGPDQFATVFQDISEQKKSAIELNKTKKLLEETQAITKIGGWEFDVETNELTWTKETFKIHGVQGTENPVDLNTAVSFYESEHSAIIKNLFEKALKQAEPYDVELQIKRTDGEKIWIRTIGQPHAENGRVVKVTGNIQDITERKLAEKEKERLQAQLMQAQKMESIGTLAGGIAHDFNNMLSIILGNVEMIIEDIETSNPLFSNLGEVQKAAKRSADLTRQLLAFARKQTISPKVLNLNETIDGMLKMLRRLIGEDIGLLWLPGDNVWPVKVDPSQIDQILANLCVNARDAIADVGKVTIETSNTEFDDTYCSDHPGFLPGEYVVLAVSDNGCGMDAKTLENIYEPFYTTKKSGQGTGLGLSTVYGIVKQNNGFINAYSEPGQGTTFNLYFPRYKTKEGTSLEKATEHPIERGHETIFLVEDEVPILRMAEQMLERLGYQVISARTPGEAIRLAQEYKDEIHLLMTDVVMPEMNGRDLAKNILSIHPNLKRLFMSGYTANVIAHHGVLDAGVNFIQKPFSREELGKKVREALDMD